MTVREILANKRAEKVAALKKALAAWEARGPGFFVPLRNMRFDGGPLYSDDDLARGAAHREAKLAQLRAALARAEAEI